MSRPSQRRYRRAHAPAPPRHRSRARAAATAPASLRAGRAGLCPRRRVRRRACRWSRARHRGPTRWRPSSGSRARVPAAPDRRRWSVGFRRPQASAAPTPSRRAQMQRAERPAAQRAPQSHRWPRWPQPAQASPSVRRQSNRRACWKSPRPVKAAPSGAPAPRSSHALAQVAGCSVHHIADPSSLPSVRPAAGFASSDTPPSACAHGNAIRRKRHKIAPAASNCLRSRAHCGPEQTSG